jgi:hypothetical protein
MSNFQKSFNFRNGVQVDTDDLIVRGSLVGIGTTVPTEQLDVRGTTKVVGLVTAQNLHIVGVATIATQLDVGLGGRVSISNGIITSTSGIVTYYGDARYLQGMPTSQWVDTDVGLGFTSIYAAGNVGVGTTDPRFLFQIDGNNSTTSFVNGIGFNRGGNAWITGILTAGFLSGSGANITSLNASNIASGTISNSYLPIINNDRLPTNIDKPTGIITASQFRGYFTGGVAGIATLARGLTDTPGISVGLVTASQIDLNGGIEVSGVSTFTSDVLLDSNLVVNGAVYVGSFGQSLTILTNGNVGLGTSIPSTNLQIRGSSGTSIEVISSEFDSYVSVGQSVGVGNSSAVFSYEGKTLKLTNYDTGGVNVNIHEGTGTGPSEGFKVRYDNSNLLNVTTDGKVSINRETPDSNYNLDLQGSALIRQNQVISGILTVGEGGNRVTFGDGSSFPVSQEQNFETLTGISTFNEFNIRSRLSVGSTANFASNVNLQGRIGIGTTNNSNYSVFSEGSAFFRQEIVSKSAVLISGQENPQLLVDPRSIPDSEPYSSWVPLLDYGSLQVENRGIGFVSQSLILVPYVGVTTYGHWGGGASGEGLGIKFGGVFDTTKYLARVGINTFFPRSIFDVGTASTTMNSYIIPPRVTNADLDIIRRRVDKYSPNGTTPGAFLYNVDNNRLEVGIGTTTFCGIVTLTNNHSGYYSLVPPIVNNTGRSGLAQTSFGAIIYNSSLGVHQGYGSGGWLDLTNSGTASVAGIATYAITAGIATYATTAGIATYTPTAGIATALNADSSVNTTGILTASILSTGNFGVGINIDGATISGPSVLTIDPAAVGDDTGSVRIRGNLVVDGQQTILSSTVINFADQVIGIGTTAVGDTQLNGSGIGIGSEGYQKTLLWNNTAQSLRSSENLDVASGKTYKINGTNVLSSNTLGSGVVNSSLTSVGTLTKLDVGNVNSTGIITATSFSGAFTGTVTGTASTANYALIAGIATNVIGGIASVTQLNVNGGISTVGVVTSGNIFSTGIVTATRFTSNVAQGTAPISVASSTKVTNLNVDYLDDKDGAWYLDYNNFTSTPTIGNGTLTLAVSGNGLSGSQTFSANQTGNATFTVTSNADSANTNNAIVSRNGLGGFAAGIITATEFKGSVTGNVVGNVTGNLSGNVNSTGISTFNSVIAGSATTALIVNGSARVTGILTVGTGSITLNGNTDNVNVGTGVTIYGSVGVVSATTFRGTLAGFAATAGYAITSIQSSTSEFANASETSNTSNTATTLTASSNVNTSGIITATGGFSGAFGGAPVVITVSGSVLTFTVNGVGSTSLTLYP